MKKQNSIPQIFSYSGTITDNHCQLGFPKGTILKGCFVPFQAERAALRPCQVVAVTNTNGGIEARFCRSVIRNKIIAVLHKVVLPKREATSITGYQTGGQIR